MAPKQIKEGQTNSMHYKHTTGSAKSFECGYQSLFLAFDQIDKDQSYRRKSVLKILVKVGINIIL
jgi:hypothetical protein